MRTSRVNEHHILYIYSPPRLPQVIRFSSLHFDERRNTVFFIYAESYTCLRPWVTHIYPKIEDARNQWVHYDPRPWTFHHPLISGASFHKSRGNVELPNFKYNSSGWLSSFLEGCGSFVELVESSIRTLTLSTFNLLVPLYRLPYYLYIRRTYDGKAWQVLREPSISQGYF